MIQRALRKYAVCGKTPTIAPFRSGSQPLIPNTGRTQELTPGQNQLLASGYRAGALWRLVRVFLNAGRLRKTAPMPVLTAKPRADIREHLLAVCPRRLSGTTVSIHNRRGGRVAECTGLLNRRTPTRCTAGSNPALSVAPITHSFCDYRGVLMRYVYSGWDSNTHGAEDHTHAGSTPKQSIGAAKQS